MHCEYGGEVTFTQSEPGYRLRIFNSATVSVILSKNDVERLQHRMRDLLADDETSPTERLITISLDHADLLRTLHATTPAQVVRLSAGQVEFLGQLLREYGLGERDQ